MQFVSGLILCFSLSCSLSKSLFNDYYDNDYFTETGYVLTPSDRQSRDLSLDFPQLDESLDYSEVQRSERDGGSHGHRAGRRFGRVQASGGLNVPGDNRRQGRENSFGQGNRRQQNRRSGQQQQFEESQDFNFEQDGRQGRQSGDVGLALGVLNNPPREDGSYNFNFANDDGSSRQEVGNPASDAMLVSGSYSFITPEGELVEMQYTADEFGYHASGSHMPTTPPPPPHVRRLLEHLAKVNGDFVY